MGRTERKAPQTVPVQPIPKVTGPLFPPLAVGGATLIGGLLAASILLCVNFHALGKKRRGWIALACGLGVAFYFGLFVYGNPNSEFAPIPTGLYQLFIAALVPP